MSRVYERRTCLRRESISSSFCLIWARRCSHLLKGENEHSSSSGEEVDGEGARETTRSSILGEVKKVKGWGAKRTVARVRETSNKNGRHWRGVSLTLAHFWVFGLRQYIRACQTCSACTRSHQEGNSISFDKRTRLGFWGVRELSWQTQIGRNVSADFTCQRERTHLETLAIRARSGAE